ncbi:MAG: hypothetical protein ACI9W1_001902, partial [Candidatus Azotimanducaceae bacterium]
MSFEPRLFFARIVIDLQLKNDLWGRLLATPHKLPSLKVYAHKFVEYRSSQLLILYHCCVVGFAQDCQRFTAVVLRTNI